MTCTLAPAVAAGSIIVAAVSECLMMTLIVTLTGTAIAVGKVVKLVSCTPVITCHIEFIVAVIVANINLIVFAC